MAKPCSTSPTHLGASGWPASHSLGRTVGLQTSLNQGPQCRYVPTKQSFSLLIEKSQLPFSPIRAMWLKCSLNCLTLSTGAGFIIPEHFFFLKEGRNYLLMLAEPDG